MADHINRWLLVFASAYLFLLPTNAATFAVSLAFGGAALCAVTAFILAWRNPATHIPMAGPSILVPLGAWALWSCASIAWSVDPAYSRGQLAREVMDSLLAMFIFYVAARDAHSLRVLIGAAFASLACLALLAIGMAAMTGTWDAGRWHHGVGAWSTWLVLIAPFLFALLAPPPAGFGRGTRSLVVGFLLLALMVATARMTDNRVVWIALAVVFATASLVAALRWPRTFARSPLRWIAPLAVLLVVLGFAFTDVLRASARRPRHAAASPCRSSAIPGSCCGSALASASRRGRGRATASAAGFSPVSSPPKRAIRCSRIAHNVFASQWLQTGLVGMAAFIAFLAALAARYVRFVRSRDDSLAFVGVVGLALLAGFVAKDLTDDFLFRSNAKELWAMSSFLLGYGMRRERVLVSGPNAAAARAAATPPHLPPRPSESA